MKRDFKSFLKKYLKQGIALLLALAIVVSYGLYRSSERTLRAGGFPEETEEEAEVVPDAGATQAPATELVLDELPQAGEEAREENVSGEREEEARQEQQEEAVQQAQASAEEEAQASPREEAQASAEEQAPAGERREAGSGEEAGPGEEEGPGEEAEEEQQAQALAQEAASEARQEGDEQGAEDGASGDSASADPAGGASGEPESGAPAADASKEEETGSGPEDAAGAGATETGGGQAVFFQGTADTLTFEGPDYTVTASYGEEAGIPAGASLAVVEITEESGEYQAYSEQAQAAVGESEPEGTLLETDGGQEVAGTGSGPAAGAGASAHGSAEGSRPGSGAQTGEGSGAGAPFGGQAGGDAGSGGEAGGIVRSVSWVRLFDITIMLDGAEIEPQGPVSVQIAYHEAIGQTTDEEVSTVHFEGSGETPVVLETQTEGSETALEQVSFEAEGFSVFAIVVTRIEKVILASDGNNYRISVTGGSEAGIPADAQLAVDEILPAEADTESAGRGNAGTAQEQVPGSARGAGEAPDAPQAEGEDAGAGTQTGGTDTGSLYAHYVARTEDALGWEAGTAGYIRLFDIRIVSGTGEKVGIGAPVDVQIELMDKESAEQTQVVHFADGSGAGDVMDAVEVGQAQDASEGVTLSFAASGFSVYAIVGAPEPFAADPDTAASLADVAANAQRGFILSLYEDPRYISSGMNAGGCLTEVKDISAAAVWFFEPVQGTEDRYYLYTVLNGEKNYIGQEKAGSNNLTLVNGGGAGTEGAAPAGACALDVSEAGGGTFYIKHAGENRWLQHSNGGGGLRFYTDNKNQANSRITLTYAGSVMVPDDYYALDGKAYGIAYHNDTAAAAALMAQEKDGTHLEARDMLMRPDVLKNDGILLVAQSSDITEWTFHGAGENRYYITAQIAGGTRYLALAGQALSLADAEDGAALFTVTSGTGENSGKYQFTVNGVSVSLDLDKQDTSKGFKGAGGNAAASWLNLVERSVLTEEDFHLYGARKVSVSDTANVATGRQVILYTRIWNETARRYEFYAVDHDGTLIRCYDTGDGIEWIGSNVNTALWEFTDYPDADGAPTYYYELRNVQYGDYIAPLASSGQVLADSPAGINLNGRRYGENYTTVIAWDGDSYAYSGLKALSGRIAACPLSEAEDFYFAVVDPVEAGDRLTEVATVDNERYGITMKMIDFNNPLKNERDSVQHPFFGAHANSYEPGLLSTDLSADGYPVTTARTGHEAPLSELFKDMQPANHLFIESIHNESGYFEYDSTSNFARLGEDGDFTVYDQIAAIGTSTGPTRTHGQFMPYNAIEAGKFAADSSGNPITNQTDVLAQELADTDPRKGERLYSIPQAEADYYFGMEMEAGFTQTADGLDAWGHDIIFEFSGDDDFWLYVDGELVLDLGGVRSAMTGNVNFRTGEIHSTGSVSLVTKGGTVSKPDYTLREVFESNYRTRNPGASEEDVQAFLAGFFGADGTVFRDYSNHTMKMFYMERGAGASNLRMRFNLAAVKPGTVVLRKKLSGTDSPANSLIEFPYQVWYRVKGDGGDAWHRLEEETDGTRNVTYQGSVNPVPWRSTFTPAGGTAPYRDVFFLKPGEAAEIRLPDDTLDYYAVECGVDPSVYDAVTANGAALTGVPADGNGGRSDYAAEPASMADRPEVEFDNHVSEGAMRTLSITKILYDADGQTRLHYDEGYGDQQGEKTDRTLFDLRLYLGTENDRAQDLPAANLYSYYVKDADGNYCRWDREEKRFVSLGVTEFSGTDAGTRYLQDLLAGMTGAERESIIFSTSMNGSISRIPADYTVEVRDLIVGTQWKVEERDSEIPKGYTLRLEDGYTVLEDGAEHKYGTAPVSGTMEAGRDPRVQVRNQKGWGLTVEKVWTDRDFMEEHDPVYFAVYVKKDAEAGSYELLADSVRRLGPRDSSIYYFFDNLQSGTPFGDYAVFEVSVEEGEGFSVDRDGTVHGAASVTPLGDGDLISLGGKPAGGAYAASGYAYTVHYAPGEQTTQNENVRTDTVTNSRPGIEVYKTDWAGEPLAGALFTLVDADGGSVGAAGYVSAEETGLVTTAYLPAGTYTLRETRAPRGYAAMPAPVEITVDPDNSVHVDGPAGFYEVREGQNGSMTAAIFVKNRPSAFQVKKADAQTGSPLADAHFALYRQVTDNDGNKVKYYLPMQGYEDLVTDANGILDRVTMDLPAGTYYLTETQAPAGWSLLGEDVCFSIGDDGTAAVLSDGHADWLSEVTGTTAAASGTVSYTITVPDRRQVYVELLKTDMSAGTPLEGAAFSLYADAACTLAVEGIRGLVTGQDGLLELGTLPAGKYYLVEDSAPDGYNGLEGPVEITVAPQNPAGHQVTAMVYNSPSVTSRTVTAEGGAKRQVYTITVPNGAGYELPSTGGPGTRAGHLACLLLGALALLAVIAKLSEEEIL